MERGGLLQAAFTLPGPYGTTTGTVADAAGTVIYDLFYPSNYATLGFKSPIVTWGNGTGSTPGKYSALLSHLASYGFTVIASTLPNTGSAGKPADHASIQNAADGGNPGGFLGYATAWLEYQLRGNAAAAGAFTGAHPELATNANWPGSMTK